MKKYFIFIFGIFPISSAGMLSPFSEYFSVLRILGYRIFYSQQHVPSNGIYANSIQGQQVLTNFYTNQQWAQNQQPNNSNNPITIHVKKETFRPR